MTTIKTIYSIIFNSISFFNLSLRIFEAIPSLDSFRNWEKVFLFLNKSRTMIKDHLSPRISSGHELVPTPSACATAKKGKKGKRKGKSVAEPPKKYLPSVRAKWITQHENGRVESVFLDPARFNRPSAVEFGWYIDTNLA